MRRASAASSKRVTRRRQKGLAVVSGLCWRYHPAVQETVRRIVEDKADRRHRRDSKSCYNAGTLWHRGDKPEWSRMEYQIRNWLYFNWLSGDHICEQAVHSLDKTAWVQGDIHPVRAFGIGGRQQRTGSRVSATSTITTPCSTNTRAASASTSCAASKRTAPATSTKWSAARRVRPASSAYKIEGENPWQFDKEAAKKIDMYDLEHVGTVQQHPRRPSRSTTATTWPTARCSASWAGCVPTRARRSPGTNASTARNGSDRPNTRGTTTCRSARFRSREKPNWPSFHSPLRT